MNLLSRPYESIFPIFFFANNWVHFMIELINQLSFISMWGDQMIKLIGDSTCDLSDEIIQKYQIGIAPLTINIDGKTYKDRIDITAMSFLRILLNIKRILRRPCLHLQVLSTFLKRHLLMGITKFYAYACPVRPVALTSRR